MSRIDVKLSKNGKFAVFVNFCQFGVELSSSILANHVAETIKQKHYPHAEIYLLNTKKV
jgi:hypothetical protein